MPSNLIITASLSQAPITGTIRFSKSLFMNDEPAPLEDYQKPQPFLPSNLPVGFKQKIPELSHVLSTEGFI